VPGKDGSCGTFYRAVLSDDTFSLEKSSVASVASNPRYLVFQDSAQIARLRSARVHVIVSSHSGAGLATTAYDRILAPLLKLFSIEVAVHSTTSKTSHREYLANLQLFSGKENIFVVLGGDTLIYDFLNATLTNPHLKSADRLILCPIPCGTGNALAMSLGRTSIPIGISSLFCNKEAKPLPLLEITVHEGTNPRTIWAAVVCSWGLHASLVADSDDPEMRRKFGPKRFGVYSGV